MENETVHHIEATSLLVGNRGQNVIMRIEASGNVAHQIEVRLEDAKQLSEALKRITARLEAKANMQEHAGMPTDVGT